MPPNICKRPQFKSFKKERKPLTFVIVHEGGNTRTFFKKLGQENNPQQLCDVVHCNSKYHVANHPSWKIRSSNFILNGCGSTSSNENKLFNTVPQFI